jgi:hypothetical protein
MEKELEVLEKIQNDCKSQPWCGLCKYADMGCGCTLGRPGNWNLTLLKKEAEMKKEAEKND